MKEFNWVAQDRSGSVYLYKAKPNATTAYWWVLKKPDQLIIWHGMSEILKWKESLIDLRKNDYIIKDGLLMKTRKHAALIHAWADGAVIQYQDIRGDCWTDCVNNVPEWNPSHEYRIKPKIKTLRFINYIFEGSIKVHKEGDPTPNPKFTRWIGDWQEVEIEL